MVTQSLAGMTESGNVYENGQMQVLLVLLRTCLLVSDTAMGKALMCVCVP